MGFNPAADNAGIYLAGHHDNVRSLDRLGRHTNHEIYSPVNHTYELVGLVTGTPTQNVENSWDAPHHA